jgi:nucleotide-binding universal stress UspA family protein
MKRIVIPTDFSEVAGYAETAAIHLAQTWKASLLYCHVSEELPEGWEKKKQSQKVEDLEAQEIAKRITSQLQKRVDQARDAGLDADLQLKTGKLWRVIKDLSESKDIDMIIMGSHGVSGKEEYFIGSNTQKVVRKATKDVLIIKHPLEQLSFKKVMFATGLNKNDKEAFDKFLELMAPFGPDEIHILAINTPGYFGQPTILMHEGLKELAGMVEGSICKTHFLSDFTVEGGIRHFSEEIGVDLIALSNHDRHPLKRILQGSNIEFLVNHAEVPVLALDF